MIEDIITGQNNDPSRIIAFNMAEGWARDVTEDVWRARSSRVQRENLELRERERTFVERETGIIFAAE